MAARVNSLPKPSPSDAGELHFWGWGGGDEGQLGPELRSASKPKQSRFVEDGMAQGLFGGGLEAVAAGGMHTVVIDANGHVWSFGVNDEAALGRVTENVPDPEQPGRVQEEETIAATPTIVAALEKEGFRAVRVAAGDNVSVAVSDQGDVRMWGNFRDSQGSLGFAGKPSREYNPSPAVEFSRRSGVREKAVNVAAGDNHVLLLSTHGRVYGLGINDYGQLGRRIIGRRKIHSTIAEAVMLGYPKNKAKYIGASNNCSFAVDINGVVWGWGMNSSGQTGTGRMQDPEKDRVVDVPREVLKLSAAELGGTEKVVQIAGGEFHSLFLTSKGTVYACGAMDDKQLGLPANHPALAASPKYVAVPTAVPFPAGTGPIKHVSAGPRFSVAVAKSGAVFAWGAQSTGELGLGTDDDFAATPTRIKLKDSWAGITVSCGGQHSVALFAHSKKSTA